MTKNAAALLADLIDGWTVTSGQRPEQVRGFSSPHDLGAWRANNVPVDLLRTVDNLIQGMAAAGEDISMFEPSITHWYSAVHFGTLPWGNAQQGGNPRRACPETHVALLRAFGAVINGWQPISLDEADQRSLADVLAQAEELIDDESTHMPADVRFYLWGLIARARKVVEHLDEYGAQAAREVCIELGGALIVHGEQVKTDGDAARGSRIQAAGVMLVSGFMGTFGGDGANLAIEGVKAAARQITGG